MATVWAKSNGNWSTASIWAFWNETTQQIEDYGQVPQVDDVVYCNGYDVTIDADYIKVEAIRNGLVIHTNRIGGKFITRVSHTYQLECNIYSDVTNDYILTFRGCTYNETHTQVIIGNVQSVQGAYSLHCTDAKHTISINGNTNGQVYYASSGAGSKTFKLTINGNVVANVIGVSSNGATSPPINLIVNGNVDLSGNLVEYGRNLNYHQVGKLSLIGQNSSLNVTQYTGFTAYTITLDGILSIKDKSLYEIFNTNDLSLKTTSGMSIETEYDYPQQSDVKKDVPYAYGQMVGTYQPEFPQEAVVLKDVEYARVLTVADDIALYSGDTYRYNGTTWSLLQTIGETTTDVTAVVDTDSLIGFLGTTTTDIVTTPSTNPVTINGNSVTAQTDEYVRYGISVYQWNGSAWVLAYTDQRSNPTIIINGSSVTATDGDIVMYDNNCYRWDAILTLWVKLSYVGETTTDISGGSTRDMLFIIGESMKGTLEVSLPQVLLDRLANCVTVDILDAQLNAKL